MSDFGTDSLQIRFLMQPSHVSRRVPSRWVQVCVSRQEFFQCKEKKKKKSVCLKQVEIVSLAVNTVDYLDLLTKDLKQLVAEQRWRFVCFYVRNEPVHRLESSTSDTPKHLYTIMTIWGSFFGHTNRSALSPEGTASRQDDNTDPRKVWFETEYQTQRLKSQGQKV